MTKWIVTKSSGLLSTFSELKNVESSVYTFYYGMMLLVEKEILEKLKKQFSLTSSHVSNFYSTEMFGTSYMLCSHLNHQTIKANRISGFGVLKFATLRHDWLVLVKMS